MRHESILAWQHLYGAVGVLSAICAVCALLKTIFDLRAGAIEPPGRSAAEYILWLPRIWLRFQIAYLGGFPSIVAIAILYAHYIGFSAFIP